jgi:hypothetical protein
VIGVVGAAVGAEIAATHREGPPDFSGLAGWQGTGPDYQSVAGALGPVISDPAHPYFSNAAARRAGGQPTFRVADLANPNLKPSAKAVMKRENDKVLAGGIGYTPRSSCMPAGVPAFMLFPVVEPIYFLQTPKQVTIVFSGDAQVRRIYLDVPHSDHPKPSWYGESVGHYEGDTLVIDTIGLNTKTFVDVYRTPHTEKLHVVERFTIAPDGKTLTALVKIEDPTPSMRRSPCSSAGSR